jgi:hypothetical protein
VVGWRVSARAEPAASAAARPHAINAERMDTIRI